MIARLIFQSGIVCDLSTDGWIVSAESPSDVSGGQLMADILNDSYPPKSSSHYPFGREAAELAADRFPDARLVPLDEFELTDTTPDAVY